MTAKKLVAAVALLAGMTLGATTATFAQAYSYGYPGQGYYDYAPGYAPYYDYGPSLPNCDRGGPGPRSGCGSGMGIGAVR
jgi:hypothetical protein